MTIGEQIRLLRKNKRLTQKELAVLAGTAENTIRQYELGLRKPRIEQLANIANSLGVTVNDLVGAHTDKYYCCEQKLTAVGYTIGFEEDNAYLWIDYPDGTLEITEKALFELNDDCDQYLLFKLNELKRRNLSDFHAKK